MTPREWEEIDRVWHAVLARPEADRAAALTALCAGNGDLRRSVESLLGHLARASDAGFGAAPGALTREPLAPGTGLGPYLIGPAIGAGGMGAVYRARDTRLARDVAIKVLPVDLARDPVRLARFEEEARAAAALNHPNVLAVHDVGSERVSRSPEHESSGASGASGAVEIPFIVTELLEGRTLRELLTDGPLSCARAIELAMQLADGLAAAHVRGIVHRDLKPENLFVTSNGLIKILDFGLAKAVADASPGVETPTDAAADSRLIAGTPGYMAPEQARGHHTDRRADIFAFGAILFEMLTGQRAFGGDTALERMSAVLKDAPAAALSTPGCRVPRPVVRIVERCLEREPAARFQSATDLAFAFKVLKPLDVNALPPRTLRSVWLTRPVAAALLVAFVVVWLFRTPPAEPRSEVAEAPSESGAAGGVAAAAGPARGDRAPKAAASSDPPRGTSIAQPLESRSFTIGEPAGASFETRPPLLPYPALSPDGQQLVFVATRHGGPRQLWLWTKGVANAHALQGTEGAGGDSMQPFWSPDGHSIGFVSNDALKRIDLRDGRVTTIWESVGEFDGGTWAPEGTIVLAGGKQGLWRVSSDGGAPQRIYTPDSAKGQRFVRRPSFLPDGRHLTFLVTPGDQVVLGSVDGSEQKILTAGQSAGYYHGGFLVYVRAAGNGVGTVVAQRFDLDTLSLSGDPIGLVDNVFVGINGAAFSLSSSGALVYRVSRPTEPAVRLKRFTRDGREIDSSNRKYRIAGFDLFPDGRRVLLAMNEGLREQADLHILDFVSGNLNRLTSGPANDHDPVLSPDGRMVLWQRTDASGETALYRRATDGSGHEEFVGRFPGALTNLTHWSDRGIVATVRSPKTALDVWYFDASDPSAAQPYQQAEWDEQLGRLSPDGQFMAFNYYDEVQTEILIRPFPHVENGMWPVPGSQGGRFAHWRGDAKELYFKANGHMMAAEVETGATVSITQAHPLFELPDGADFRRSFAVTSDGQTFLLPVPDSGAQPEASPVVTPLTVVPNWKELLPKR